MSHYIYYFNPENDLALASGDAHYTPPASALQMAKDLQRLPLLWAQAGDRVLLRTEPPSEGPSSAFTTRAETVASDARYLSSSLIFTVPPLAGRTGGESAKGWVFLPWGWSPLAARQLKERGVPPDLLPTAEQLDAYRAASSRRLAVQLLRLWRTQCPDAFREGTLVGESSWCTTLAAVAEACSRYGRSMLKAPWSGSGRGVHPVRAALSARDEAWALRTLQRQGAVEVEPLYDRILDFAMEFWAERGSVRYCGLSLFSTTPGGVYAGNLIAPEADKERMLSRYVSPALLVQLREQLVSLLSTCGLPSWYTGPVGVDMMIVNKETPLPMALHPLVEINLRMTMGWVALQLASQLPHERHGRFRIVHADGHYRHEITFFEA